MSLTVKWLLPLLILTSTFTSARGDTNARIACMGNLKQIDGAVQQWADENHLSDTNTYSLQNQAILRNLPGGYLMNCPGGGAYLPGHTVGDEPHCTLHGSLTDMHREYMAARKKHNLLQIGMGIGAGFLVWLTLHWLNHAQNTERISEPTRQILAPGMLLMFGLVVFMIPQDSLRPSFGIVYPILHIPTAVLFFCGLVVTIRTIIVGRKIPLIVLCVFSVVFVLLLRLIFLWWLMVLRR